MPAYNYQAIDEAGRRKKGVIAADSMRDARRLLKATALYPTRISLALKEREGPSGLFDFRRIHISETDLVMITRQMATMISTGTPVDETLAALAAQSENKAAKIVLTRLRSQVVEGKYLSEAMAAEKKSFDKLYRAMVRAGEMSGDLGAVLEKLADFCEKSQDVKSKIQAALIYPSVLSVVALSVLSLLMIFVVPKVVAQFDSYEANLPLLTVAVMAVSDFLVDYGLYLLIFMILAGFLAGVLMAKPAVKYRRDAFLLRLPLMGRLIRSVSGARFARTLGTLVEGGSPILQSMRAAIETIKNDKIKRGLEGAYNDVSEGSALSQALKKSAVFPPLVVHMCAAGEKSGALAPLMIKVADHLENEFDRFTQTALGLLEPMIVIIMGIMVGLIVMSIMLPIMQLNKMVLV